MKNNKQKPNFLINLFDVNKNGRINPAEIALTLMVCDEEENSYDRKKTAAFPLATPHETYVTINIDDIDIEGI